MLTFRKNETSSVLRFDVYVGDRLKTVPVGSITSLGFIGNTDSSTRFCTLSLEQRGYGSFDCGPAPYDR